MSAPQAFTIKTSTTGVFPINHPTPIDVSVLFEFLSQAKTLGVSSLTITSDKDGKPVSFEFAKEQ